MLFLSCTFPQTSMARMGVSGRRRENENKRSCAGGTVQVFGFKNKSPEKLLSWNFQEISFASQHGPKKPGSKCFHTFWDAINDQSNQTEEWRVVHLATGCNTASSAIGGWGKATEDWKCFKAQGKKYSTDNSAETSNRTSWLGSVLNSKMTSGRITLTLNVAEF